MIIGRLRTAPLRLRLRLWTLDHSGQHQPFDLNLPKKVPETFLAGTCRFPSLPGDALVEGG
jgi:hypothetical protein